MSGLYLASFKKTVFIPAPGILEVVDPIFCSVSARTNNAESKQISVAVSHRYAARFQCLLQ